MPRSLFGLFGLLSLGVAGCMSGPIHDIDTAVDCGDLCGRYADCFDSSYDQDACRARCHDIVTRDPNAANECDTCLDAHACSESFGCSGPCYGLIP